MKHIRPMIFFVTLLMLVSLACSALGGGGGSAPTQEPVNAGDGTGKQAA